MTGELAVTIVGTYDNMIEVVAAWDAGTDTTPATDSHELHIESGIGPARHHLIKIVKAP